MQEDARALKYGFRGSFSPIHHLSNYIERMVNIAFWQDISDSRSSRIRLSGIIESVDAKWTSGRKRNHRLTFSKVSLWDYPHRGWPDSNISFTDDYSYKREFHHLRM